ncbi:MAG: asparagine synthetase, partial [Spirosoma sp.]|nr:asparagine synthetase [Spirosoma sp.]
MKRLLLPLILILTLTSRVWGSKILIPMDDAQKNHLKAYGIAYWVLKTHDTEIDWLLNYRGGSFMMPQSQAFINEMVIRGVSYEVISDAQSGQILAEIAAPDANMDAVKLQKPPKVAVYSPKTKQPWDDAVTMVMTYAEIPYDVIFDEEVMNTKLPEYDWLHLHHEDFTGQYGKFFHFKDQPWYIAQKQEAEAITRKFGFTKVPQLKLAVAQHIRDFVLGGGYLFAMCNATDTYDIALASHNTDIVDSFYDGDPADPNANNKLDFSQTFAFRNFQVITNPYYIEFSNIDNQPEERGL